MLATMVKDRIIRISNSSSHINSIHLEVEEEVEIVMAMTAQIKDLIKTDKVEKKEAISGEKEGQDQKDKRERRLT